MINRSSSDRNGTEINKKRQTRRETTTDGQQQLQCRCWVTWESYTPEYYFGARVSVLCAWKVKRRRCSEGSAVLIAGLRRLPQSSHISLSSGTTDIQLKWGGGKACWLPPRETARARLGHDDQQLHQTLLPPPARCLFINTQHRSGRATSQQWVFNVLIWVQRVTLSIRQFDSWLSFFFCPLWQETAECFRGGSICQKSSHFRGFVRNESAWNLKVYVIGIRQHSRVFEMMHNLRWHAAFWERQWSVMCRETVVPVLRVSVRVCGFRKAPYFATNVPFFCQRYWNNTIREL